MSRVLPGGGASLAGAAALLALAACGSSQEPATVESASSARSAAAGEERASEAQAGAAADPAQAGPGAGSPAASSAIFRVVGLRPPRSVLHDPEADVYLVSNVNGDPAGADDYDNGFISRISPDGPGPSTSSGSPGACSEGPPAQARAMGIGDLRARRLWASLNPLQGSLCVSELGGIPLRPPGRPDYQKVLGHPLHLSASARTARSVPLEWIFVFHS